MLQLINIGIDQGIILGFPEGTSEKSISHKNIASIIQSGRFGESQNKGISPANLFVVLTQDCSIANKSKCLSPPKITSKQSNTKFHFAHY